MAAPNNRDRCFILSGLRRDHEVPMGPLSAGLADGDYIRVASFHNPYVCQRFRHRLASAGVDSTSLRGGLKTVVKVRNCHREVAWKVLAEQRVNDPDQCPTSVRKSYDYTMLGAIIGLFIGVLLFMTPRGIIGLIGALLSGILLGLCADRFTRSYRFGERFRFGILDLLLGTAAVAALLGVWKLGGNP